MRTIKLGTKTLDPSGPRLCDSPTMDDAGVWMRPEGRQLVISTGRTPEKEEEEGDDPERGDPPDMEEKATPPARERGDITGFSEDARRRLRDRLHAMKRDASGLFVTLTYHEHLPTPEEAHEDLDNFGRWVQRHFPGTCIVWKKEPQDRGWPHFHMLITGVEYIPVQRMAGAWHSITEETSIQHRKSGVDVEPMVNEDGKLQNYFAKYMAECYDGWPAIMGHRMENAVAAKAWSDRTGRWWGVIGRDNFPWADWDIQPRRLTRPQARKLIGLLLDEWGTDLPEGVIPRTLTVNCRGDPADRLPKLLSRL